MFKLDPDRSLDDDALSAVCLSGTDAIMVGGSSGITYNNTEELLERIRSFDTPCVQEVSDLQAVVPGFDLYMIPMVLNTENPDWLVGQQARALERYGDWIPWELLVPEGYIILNPNCTAAAVSEANSSLSITEATAYAQVADKLMQLPIVYLEYSGSFGDMELVANVHRVLGNARLFYGGGIKDAASASRAAAVCDTIIVGNAVYNDLQQALATVAAVKERGG